MKKTVVSRHGTKPDPSASAPAARGRVTPASRAREQDPPATGHTPNVESGHTPVAAPTGFDRAPAVAELSRIGVVRSTLRAPGEAPKQGDEGAPDAWIEMDAPIATGLEGIRPGDELIIITWLHKSSRTTLHVHPRGDTRRPLCGVFATRSPHRPNPLGLHQVRVYEVTPRGLRVGPIEAIDGTPVVDIKPTLRAASER